MSRDEIVLCSLKGRAVRLTCFKVIPVCCIICNELRHIGDIACILRREVNRSTSFICELRIIAERNQREMIAKSTLIVLI